MHCILYSDVNISLTKNSGGMEIVSNREMFNQKRNPKVLHRLSLVSNILNQFILGVEILYHGFILEIAVTHFILFLQ